MYEELAIRIGSVVALGALFVLFPIALHVYQRYRWCLALRCPDTGLLTSVRLDAGRATWTSLFGEPKLRVKDCARWPEKRDCPQGCLADAAAEGAARRLRPSSVPKFPPVS